MGYVRKNSGARSPKRSSEIALAAYNIEPDMIEFEDEASQVSRNFLDHLILMYGAPKTGKTTLLSKFEGIYLLPTEPGYFALKVRKTPINNWATFRKFIEKAEGSAKFRKTVKAFGIDTVDNLSKFCMQYVCGRDGIAHPSDEEWGKGWEAYRDEFTHWILRLCNMGCGVIFVSHEAEREVTSRNMKITKYSPALPKTSYTVVNNLVDIILHLGFTEAKNAKGKTIEKRCLFSKPTEQRDAGDRTKLLPSRIIFDTEDEAMKAIESCFKKGGKIA